MFGDDQQKVFTADFMPPLWVFWGDTVPFGQQTPAAHRHGNASDPLPKEGVMLTREDNELLCQTGPGTPMGNFSRRFWQPVLLAKELSAPDCTPVRSRVLSENLVACRDSNDNVGVVDASCQHRRAGLFFGRNEACRLCCVYHGWECDIHGNCTDMPSEPAESNFITKVKTQATRPKSGALWSGSTWAPRT
ncbi:hypothetical protein NKDENANG_03711 [Candidatus Entotheonellaceae bacterium PAL068K]